MTRVYTQEMGQPPVDIDGASAAPKRRPTKSKKPVKPNAPVKMAKGGKVKRGYGCAIKG
jgi:hypothetical protein